MNIRLRHNKASNGPACYGQRLPIMVKDIKFERVSPFQGRIEKPRSSISGYGMYGNLRQDWSKLI